MMLVNAPDIRFPGLGIEIGHLPSGIMLPIGNGFEIKMYGIIICMGIFCGYYTACRMGKKEKISSDTILDFLLYAMVFGICGARLYYVAFEWDNYKDNLLQIFNIRGGGLAIYGAVIASFTTMFIYTRIKKMSFFRMADICVPGLLVGQIMGRWGNFCNCEAFGDYYDGFLSMMILKSKVYSGYITQRIADNVITYDGAEYISVHPTFLYESLWNLGALILMLFIHKYKRFDGQMFWSYLCFYGLGRFWIEGLRTDQLQIGTTGLAVSQLLSGCLILVGAAMITRGLVKTKGKGPMSFLQEPQFQKQSETE